MTVLPLKPREVPVPLPGQAISVVLSLAATTVLTNFLSEQRLPLLLVAYFTNIMLQRNELSLSKYGGGCHWSYGVSRINSNVVTASSANVVTTVVFAIYTDSYLFVSATAILQHTFGVNSSLSVCRGAILLCLVCYVSTKVSDSNFGAMPRG